MDDNYIRVTPKGEIYVDNLSKLFYTEECFKKPQPIAVEIATGRGISLSGMQL
jgi:tRNA G46 methylase TrmB